MLTKDKGSMKYYLYKIVECFENFLWPVLAFFTPVKGIVITVSLFIFLDTVTGIWKSKKNKIPITSRRLSSIITKLLMYTSSILIVYCLDTYILNHLLENILSVDNLVTKVAALILIFIESKSINENYEEAKGVNLWKEFKSLISRTKEIKKDITDITNQNTNE